MKQINILIIAFTVLTSTQLFAQKKWEIQEDYTVYFSGTKAEGTFRGLEGTIFFDPDNLNASTFNVSLDVSTISTGNKTKDKHARGDSWFDAISFPKIQFTSTQFIKKGSNEFEASGDLVLKGITKEIIIPFTFTRNADSGLFVGTMNVNREDFGIEGNFFEFVVGDEFKVDLEIPVKTQTQ